MHMLLLWSNLVDNFQQFSCNICDLKLKINSMIYTVKARVYHYIIGSKYHTKSYIHSNSHAV